AWMQSAMRFMSIDGFALGEGRIAQGRFRRRESSGKESSGKGRIPCPLTHRRAVAETFRCQVDCPHRFVYPGSLLHHLLYALDPAADRSCAAAQLSVEADSTWTRSIEDSAAGERRVHPYRTSCTCRLWNLRASHTHGRMAPESTGRFGRTAIQAPAVKKIGGASDPGERRNREAGHNQCGK